MAGRRLPQVQTSSSTDLETVQLRMKEECYGTKMAAHQPSLCDCLISLARLGQWTSFIHGTTELSVSMEAFRPESSCKSELPAIQQVQHDGAAVQPPPQVFFQLECHEYVDWGWRTSN